MRIREVETQLRTYLPLYNDYFITWQNTTSYIVSSDVATIEASIAHNLSVGDVVHIRNVVFPNPITSLTQSLGIGTAILQNNTDLTFPPYPNQETITISGANEAVYNDTFAVTSVPDRKTINFQIDFTAASPATGSPVLEEAELVRYNGLFTVQSTPTATSFTVNVSGGVDFTAPAGVQFYNYEDVRIAGEITEERMLNAYTKQSIGSWWMFIISGAANVSKNKEIATDFDSSYDRGSYYRQQTQESVNIYVIAPTQNTITAVDAQDLARNDIKKDIMLSLGGFFPQKLFYNGYEGLFYETDAIVAYSKSYYIHSYTFSTTVNIASPDTFVSRSSAIKTIEFNHIDEINDIKSTDTINLET